MLNIVDLSLFEFFEYIALGFAVFTIAIFFLHRRNVKKIEKKAKKRSSISVSVRKMKKDDRATAITIISYTFIVCLLIFSMFFQFKYCNSRVGAYSEVIKNYEEIVKMKNEQTDMISTDCMLVIENSKSKLEDIDKIVEDIRNNYYSLQGDYANCQIERNNLKEELGKMPFIEAVKPFSENHTYDIRFFNCADFSLGAINIIRDYGYDAYLKTVKVNCSALGMNCEGTGLHAIVMVEVPFEATGFFEPISPKDFEAYGL
jgi:regulator of replication initiation timing